MDRTLVTVWEAQYRDSRVFREAEGASYANLPTVGLVAFRLMCEGQEAFSTHPPPGEDRPNLRYRFRAESIGARRFIVGWVPGPAALIDLNADECWVAESFHHCDVPEGVLWHDGHPAGWYDAPTPMGGER
jgi:hypothetical protein